jgi:hypothetical protein
MISADIWFNQLCGFREYFFFKILPEKRELPVATILTYSFLQSVILIDCPRGFRGDDKYVICQQWMTTDAKKLRKK